MTYEEFIRRELMPAFGCTEPIALAYGAARAREILGHFPQKIVAKLSGNIIKNANSVKVPGTNGRKGIEISIIAGALLGDASKKLEVLEGIDKSRLEECDRIIKENILDVELIHEKVGLYIEIIMYYDEDSARVVIEEAHTNIVVEEKNGDIILEKSKNSKNETREEVDLSFDKIYEYAKTVNYSSFKDVIKRQIEYNYEIAKEGIENPWGSNIGKLILKQSPNSQMDKLVAYAAAGSDARMSGCEKPVVINSGSGNQGITVSVPIILYCRENGIEEDLLYRGLIFANLIGLYIKEGIGQLSAYCGAVSAAAASVTGIAFVKGEELKVLKETLSNALATNSGIICDGAKASCAIKIASSLKMSFLGYEQAKTKNSFLPGDGIVKEDIDDMVKTVGNIAKDGMKETDRVILEEMIGM